MITHTIESNFWILKPALHATHLLKLLDKMCKYEMDPMSIVEDTERTRFCPQTDRRTDGQGDTSIPPFQLRWSGGYNDTCALATTFYFWLMMNRCSWEIPVVSFCEKKMFHSRGISTQNLSIHAECSAIWSGFWPILVSDWIECPEHNVTRDWTCDLVISCL